MDNTYENDVDLNKLERDFNNLSNLVDHPTNTPASTSPSESLSIKSPSNTGVKDTNRVGFLKYTDIKLKSKEEIIIFYRDLHTHGDQYNVYVTKIDDITDVPNVTVLTAIKNVTIIGITGNLLY